MKLRKLISGGQTGADRTALEFAASMGLQTGGTAPKGFRTERGADPQLALYGLKESLSDKYEDRTRDNVRDSDVTLWFGKERTPGYYATKFACDREHKLFYINPTAEQLQYIANRYEVVNVAGNRFSTNQDIDRIVWTALEAIWPKSTNPT